MSQKLMWQLGDAAEVKHIERWCTHLLVSTPAPGTRSVGGDYKAKHHTARWRLFWRVAPHTTLIPVIRVYAYPMYAADDYWVDYIGTPEDRTLWTRLAFKIERYVAVLMAARRARGLLMFVQSFAELEMYGDARDKYHWREEMDPTKVCRRIHDAGVQADWALPTKERPIYDLPAPFIAPSSGVIWTAYTPRRPLNPHGMSQIEVVAAGDTNRHGYHTISEAVERIKTGSDLLVVAASDGVAVAEQLADAIAKGTT